MNIYEKLQNIRCEVQKESFKKSGKNKFAGYEYFELADFLPKINELMLKHKISSYISFTNELAILTLVNCENPEETIQFTSPMSTATLKGCHEIQNLGAVQTYLRRYLYVNAFEIVEGDMLNGLTHKEDTMENELKSISKPVLTEAQVKRAYAIGKSKGISQDQIRSYIKSKYKKDTFKEVTKEEYDALCEYIESKPNTAH